ncbi:MAG: glycosyltransferase [Chloracidobacterium sp.]|nr:glycosyltransferase [Chloracidobacterium sp.]
MRSLYICYFGIDEPLVQTQVLPYLRELVKGGHEMSLLTFEPADRVAELRSGRAAELRKELAADGIDWYWLRYHKRLSVLATAWDVVCGVLFVSKFINHNSPNLLHARVHVPMLMAALARKVSRKRPKLLFDIRGFFPEEYVDAGIWPENGWLYRLVKRIESWLMREADGFVVLTEKARGILFPGSEHEALPVEVIPCCVDVANFCTDAESREAVRSEIGAGERYVIAYAGSFGGWYLSDEMYELFSAAREADPKVFVMVLTQRDTAAVRKRLISTGLGESDVFVASVSPDEMPRYLSAADVAVSFIKRCYSKQASSPTKNAEYLAAGLPMIVNAGVGDVDELIASERVGVMVDPLDRENYLAALTAVRTMGDVRKRCRKTAAKRFDMQTIGGERYRRIYERMNSSD